MRFHLHLPDINDATNRLIEEDKKRAVDMTEPQTAFELLSRGDMIHRLVIRLSAAQYDGHSVAILGDEARIWLGSSRCFSLMEGSYNAYLYHSRTLQSSQAVDYWRNLLAGAKPTQIAAQSGMPTFQDFVDGVLMERIETRLLDLDNSFQGDGISCSTNGKRMNITRATVVKTAWALALAELTDQDEVVFGATAWGRNAPVLFAQDVVGSCSSHVPVRARVRFSNTYAALLADLQAQHVESMRFEMLGANTIVKECTDWPLWTRLSSLVIFQGLDIDGEGQNGKDNADSLDDYATITGAVKFTEIMDPGDRADIILHVEPFGRETRVLMAFSKRRVSEATAQVMMGTFEKFLERMSQSPAGTIRLLERNALLLSTAAPHVGDICDSKTRMSGNATVAKELVRSAWTEILGVDDVEFEKCIVTQKAFLEIWGNPVSAAGIARHFKEVGLMVTTEEVLGCPSADDQISLVSRKIKGFQE